LTDKIVILVDDGIATGATLRAAIKALRILNQSFIVIAVPVGDKVVCQQIELLADQLICLLNPPDFYAVGAHYEDFAQTTDAEVHLLLAENLKQTKEVK
jgi:putative phosphoribosyl transferase